MASPEDFEVPDEPPLPSAAGPSTPGEPSASPGPGRPDEPDRRPLPRDRIDPLPMPGRSPATAPSSALARHAASAAIALVFGLIGAWAHEHLFGVTAAADVHPDSTRPTSPDGRPRAVAPAPTKPGGPEALKARVDLLADRVDVLAKGLADVPRPEPAPTCPPSSSGSTTWTRRSAGSGPCLGGSTGSTSGSPPSTRRRRGRARRRRGPRPRRRPSPPSTPRGPIRRRSPPRPKAGTSPARSCSTSSARMRCWRRDRPVPQGQVQGRGRDLPGPGAGPVVRREGLVLRGPEPGAGHRPVGRRDLPPGREGGRTRAVRHPGRRRDRRRVRDLTPSTGKDWLAHYRGRAGANK